MHLTRVHFLYIMKVHKGQPPKKEQIIMYTNNAGVSYYKRGKKYYSNSGWLEQEITKAEYDKALIQMGVK